MGQTEDIMTGLVSALINCVHAVDLLGNRGRVLELRTQWQRALRKKNRFVKVTMWDNSAQRAQSCHDVIVDLHTSLMASREYIILVLDGSPPCDFVELAAEATKLWMTVIPNVEQYFDDCETEKQLRGESLVATEEGFPKTVAVYWDGEHGYMGTADDAIKAVNRGHASTKVVHTQSEFDLMKVTLGMAEDNLGPARLFCIEVPQWTDDLTEDARTVEVKFVCTRNTAAEVTSAVDVPYAIVANGDIAITKYINERYHTYQDGMDTEIGYTNVGDMAEPITANDIEILENN